MLTWERNLLTLLLGGWLTLPGRFLPRSWNLSVIFLWGRANSLNVIWMWKMMILAQKMQNISSKTENKQFCVSFTEMGCVYQCFKGAPGKSSPTKHGERDPKTWREAEKRIQSRKRSDKDEKDWKSCSGTRLMGKITGESQSKRILNQEIGFSSFTLCA